MAGIVYSHNTFSLVINYTLGVFYCLFPSKWFT